MLPVSPPPGPALPSWVPPPATGLSEIATAPAPDAAQVGGEGLSPCLTLFDRFVLDGAVPVAVADPVRDWGVF
jgi:hypothetical protein